MSGNGSENTVTDTPLMRRSARKEKDGSLFPELNSISIPDNWVECNSPESVDKLSDVLLEPVDLTEEVIARREEYVRGHNERAVDLFKGLPTFRGSSSSVDEGKDWSWLSEHVDLDNGYYHMASGLTDRIWSMPKYKVCGVPLLYFDFGYKLPMHPFFVQVYEAIGCGAGQLTPNSVVQICGVIARCQEKKIVPTLKLLFSIYNVKYCDGLIYLDKRRGHVALVKAPSSNHAWHPHSTYFSGADLDVVGPWRDVSKTRLKELNNMPKLKPDKIHLFCGVHSRYDYKQFRSAEFLASHNLGGESLKKIIEAGDMLSERMKALLAKRGVSSIGPSRDVHGEGSSSSVAVVGERVGAEADIKPNEDEALCDRKRSRDERENRLHKRHQKIAGNTEMEEGTEKMLESPPSGTELVKVPTTPTEAREMRIEIGPKEKWAVGEKQPIQVFDAFELPQDSSSYSSLSREDLVIRSKRRFGRFASDFCRIARAFETDSDLDWRKRTTQELADLKEQVKVAETKAKESMQREGSLAKKLEDLEKSCLQERADFQRRIQILEEEMGRLRVENAEVKKLHGEASSSVGTLQKEKEDAVAAMLSLKGDLDKSDEEMTRSFEAGYTACYDRVVDAGFVGEGHEFIYYCKELNGEVGEKTILKAGDAP